MSRSIEMNMASSAATKLKTEGTAIQSESKPPTSTAKRLTKVGIDVETHPTRSKKPDSLDSSYATRSDPRGFVLHHSPYPLEAHFPFQTDCP